MIYEVEQGSQAWKDLHIGIPTSSEFDKLVTTKGEPSKSIEPYARQLAADLWAGKLLDSWQGNQWTDRGHEYEDSARAWYELMHENRIVTQVGFITNDAGTAGSSPDSCVDRDGLLEIKCLKASTHMKVIQYYQLHKKAPSDYFMQPQGQMLVGKKNWCDMLFYHPDLPQLLIRHEPDYKIQGVLEFQIGMVIELRDTLIHVLENME